MTSDFVNLSHPVGYSINDEIPKSLCSLSYITVDQAIVHIQKIDHGTLLAKIEIRHTFRLLPVHPADRRPPSSGHALEKSNLHRYMPLPWAVISVKALQYLC